jgi:WD40 repeat protein
MEYKLINTLEGHQGAIYSLCQGEEEHIVYSAGADRKVIQWNLNTMKPLKVIAQSPTTVISIFYLKEFNLLLIGQVEGGVHVIDLKEGKEKKYLKIHKGYIFDIKYIDSKKELIFCSGDGSFSIWSVSDFELLFHQKICAEKIRSVDFNLSRNEVCFALGNGEARFFNLSDWSEKIEVSNEGVAINVVKYLSDKRLLFGDKMAHLSEIDLLTYQVVKKIPAHNWPIYDIVQGENSKRFATASRDKTVKVWSSNELKVLKRFEGIKDLAHTHSVNKLLWITYKNYLLSTGDDGKIKIWQTP